MTSKNKTEHAPFPYNGGKARVADDVWKRFGSVDFYIEPFAGSLAVLLNSPYNIEDGIINDKNGLLINFWRAVQHNPEAVADHIPPFDHDLDLAAWHTFLHKQHGDLVENLKSDPTFCVPEYAARWVQGMCSWNCCSWMDSNRDMRKPHINSSRGIRSKSKRERVDEVFDHLSDTLEHFKVVCGDWTRSFNDGVLETNNLAIFLDPPYSKGNRQMCYGDFDDRSLSDVVYDFAIDQGQNEGTRIAVCGYEEEYDFPDTWEEMEWDSKSEFGDEERIWFSPHCHQEETIVDVLTSTEKDRKQQA